MATTTPARSPRKKTREPAPRTQRAARRTKPAAAAPEPAPTPAAPGGKLGVVVGLLRRPEGATVAQMSEATGWLPHSVRGALAGAIKKKHKLPVRSEKTDAGRVYRIAEAAA